MKIYQKPAMLVAFGAGVMLMTSALQPEIATATMQNQQQVEKEGKVTINNDVMVVSGRMSLGYLTGESGEYVYVPENSHKLSELKWDIERAYMLGLGGSVSPWSWLTFNADVWFNLGEGENTMDDYDWFIEGFQYTHWSHHEDVDMTTGVMFDINGEVDLYRYEKARFFAIAGFKYDNWEWEAYGGDYIYSTVFLYDTVGSFPDGEKVITYEQNYYAPYLGFGFSSALAQAPIEFSGRVVFSPYVWGEAKDQHHLRNLIFEEDFDSGTMLSLDFAGHYYFSNNLSLWLAFHYQKYHEMKGETVVTDITTGEKTTYRGDVGGMDHQSSMVSTGVSYSF